MNYTITKQTTTQGLPVWLVDTPDATTIQTTIAVRARYEYAGDARIYEVPRIVQHVLTQTMNDNHIDASAHIYQDRLQHFVAYSLQAESAPQFATKLGHMIHSLYQTRITRSAFQAAKKRTLAEITEEEQNIDIALKSAKCLAGQRLSGEQSSHPTSLYRIYSDFMGCFIHWLTVTLLSLLICTRLIGMRR